MGAATGIEWTDATWNVVGGCEIASPGCINCYAQRLAGTRLKHLPLYAGTTTLAKTGPVFNGQLTALPDGHKLWHWPIYWRGAQAPRLGAGMPSLIFVGDMSDVFHPARSPAAIDNIAYVAVALAAKRQGPRRHILQFLTKRPEAMLVYWRGLLDGRLIDGMLHIGAPPSNVWLGCSVENQRYADERREPMRQLAALGFTTYVSYEPAIGPVDWSGWEFLKQIIGGGESGRGDARPSHPDWHRATRDWCAPRGIAFFFKQWGEFVPNQEHPTHWLGRAGKLRRVGQGVWASDIGIARVGKVRAGRLLDGIEHSGFPVVP